MLQSAGRLPQTDQMDPKGTLRASFYPATQSLETEADALPSWESIPNVEFSSDSDSDQLIDDSDDERISKRQKTASGSILRRSRKGGDKLTLPITSNLEHNFSTQLIQPPSDNGPIQPFSDHTPTRKISGDFTSSHQGARRPNEKKAVVWSLPTPLNHDSVTREQHEVKSIEQPNPNFSGDFHRLQNRKTHNFRSSIFSPLRSRGFPSESTSSSSLPLASFGRQDLRLRSHRKAKVPAAISGRSKTGYYPNQDEIEKWAKASVASISFRKSTHSKGIEANARKMNGMKLMATNEALMKESSARETSTTAALDSASVRPIAIPRVSRFSLYEAMVESMFGHASSILEAEPSSSSTQLLSKRSRTPSSTNMVRSDETSMSAPDDGHKNKPIGLPFTAATLSSPFSRSPTAKNFDPVTVLATSVDKDVVGGGPSETAAYLEDVENSVISESTSATVSFPSFHFTLRPEFEELFGDQLSNTPSDQRIPTKVPLVSTPPATGNFIDAEPALILSPEELKISAIDNDSRGRHGAVGPTLVPDCISGAREETIELISPVVFETENEWRRSPDSNYGLRPGKKGDAIFDILDTRPPHSSDAVPDQIAACLSDPESEKFYGPQIETPGVFTPITHHLELPQLHLPSLHIDEFPYDDPFLGIAPNPDSIIHDDIHLFELSESALQRFLVPTVFESDYLKSRSRNLWEGRHGSELEACLMKRAVIRRVRPEKDLEDWESNEATDEEIDELADDYDQDAVSATPAMKQRSKRRDARKTSSMSFLELPESKVSVEDDFIEDDRLLNAPIGFAARIAQWVQVLRSLLKGKRKLGNKDLLYLRSALQEIHANNAHVPTSSSLAKTVIAVANLGQSDIPNEDELGLRRLARKSVRAWGLHKEHDT